MLQNITPIKNKVRDLMKVLIGKPVHNYGEFYKRITHRHKTFWKAPEAEQVRNMIMLASDPIEKWRDAPYWQRKLSNKHNSREFAKKYGCRVPDLYWYGSDPTTLDFANLPPHYVIRPTIGHSSNLVFLMDIGFNQVDKSQYPNEAIVQALLKARQENPNIQFLVEEFLKNEAGVYKIPNDYKVYAANGEIACIQVINRLSPSKGYATFYDEEWQQLPAMNTYYPKGTRQQKPGYFSEIVTQAKALSKAYEIFVRIDFYATDKGAVFGEFTPTPFKGLFFSPKADKRFIQYWDSHCKDQI